MNYGKKARAINKVYHSAMLNTISTKLKLQTIKGGKGTKWGPTHR